MTSNEKTFDFASIINLIECESHTTANKYLDLGWVLISTHLNDYGHPIERHQRTIYCLGWSRQAGEVKHPELENLSQFTKNTGDMMF